MLVVMQQGAAEPQIQEVIDRLIEMGFNVHRSTGVLHTRRAVIHFDQPVDPLESVFGYA